MADINMPKKIYENAMLFLISAMARAGFNPLGHVLEQLRMVWQLMIQNMSVMVR